MQRPPHAAASSRSISSASADSSDDTADEFVEESLYLSLPEHARVPAGAAWSPWASTAGQAATRNAVDRMHTQEYHGVWVDVCGGPVAPPLPGVWTNLPPGAMALRLLRMPLREGRRQDTTFATVHTRERRLCAAAAAHAHSHVPVTDAVRRLVAASATIVWVDSAAFGWADICTPGWSREALPAHARTLLDTSGCSADTAAAATALVLAVVPDPFVLLCELVRAVALGGTVLTTTPWIPAVLPYGTVADRLADVPGMHAPQQFAPVRTGLRCVERHRMRGADLCFLDCAAPPVSPSSTVVYAYRRTEPCDLHFALRQVDLDYARRLHDTPIASFTTFSRTARRTPRQPRRPKRRAPDTDTVPPKGAARSSVKRRRRAPVHRG